MIESDEKYAGERLYFCLEILKDKSPDWKAAEDYVYNTFVKKPGDSDKVFADAFLDKPRRPVAAMNKAIKFVKGCYDLKFNCALFNGKFTNVLMIPDCLPSGQSETYKLAEIFVNSGAAKAAGFEV